MNILQSITEYLSPGQIPVMACDCPIFSKAKYIQWTWPSSHGGDHVWRPSFKNGHVKVSHLTRIRHAHQITVAALYKLQSEAYSLSGDSQTSSYEAWRLND